MTMKPISVQLYSLREASQKDFPAVIRSIGKIGFKGVEPAGFYGLKPRELRKIVEDEGMVVSSTHGPWAKPDNLNEVIDTAKELGIDLCAGGYRPEDFADLDAIKRTAETVNLMEDKLHAAGLTLFLHNHWWEFEKIDGKLKYDIFATLAPTVKFEIDTYWSANFGANDPAAMVRKFASRAPLLHIKDGPLVKDEPMVAVGSGKVDVASVIAAADPAVLRWLVVELDACATDMLTAIEGSYRFLTSKGFAQGRS
jgi:sugar phosphate isomerase/epimerase